MLSFVLFQDFIQKSESDFAERVNSWMAEMEREIYDTTNYIRTHLAETVTRLEAMHTRLTDKNYYCERGSSPILIKEGKSVIEELIE